MAKFFWGTSLIPSHDEDSSPECDHTFKYSLGFFFFSSTKLSILGWKKKKDKTAEDFTRAEPRESSNRVRLTRRELLSLSRDVGVVEQPLWLPASRQRASPVCRASRCVEGPVPSFKVLLSSRASSLAERSGRANLRSLRFTCFFFKHQSQWSGAGSDSGRPQCPAPNGPRHGPRGRPLYLLCRVPGLPLADIRTPHLPMVAVPRRWQSVSANIRSAGR